MGASREKTPGTYLMGCAVCYATTLAWSRTPCGKPLAVPNLIIGKAEVVVPILLSKFASQKDNLKTPYTLRISNAWTL
jgi:hypothetical protein